MAIASALPSLLTATAAPAVPWLSLNVTIVDNDRGASPSSYRARALGAGAQEVPPGTVHVIKQCFSVKMWPCQASFWSRWHDPVLGRWLGLTPEQPAHFLRGFPECPRAAPSRVGDPPGLGRRGGAQGAARGAIREKRYNLPHPGVHHTANALHPVTGLCGASRSLRREARRACSSSSNKARSARQLTPSSSAGPTVHAFSGSALQEWVHRAV